MATAAIIKTVPDFWESALYLKLTKDKTSEMMELLISEFGQENTYFLKSRKVD